MTNYKKLLQELLIVVMQENASDLHISANRKPVIRVNGQLISLVKRNELNKEDTFGVLKELVSEEKLNEALNLNEIDFAFSFRDIRLRVTAYIRQGSINLAFRVIQKVKSITELKLPKILEQFSKKQQGLFLIVGPVGQGKTTTMASLINIINETRKEHIVTIENPMEYLFEEKLSLIDQREVGIDTKSFEDGLHSVFRQDVDVIMVGEMRSYETISTVVTAAETGHLVFSTLHTNNASQTIDRIIDSFPAAQQNQVRSQLAASLIGIFSQRLLPSLKGGLVPAYELMINNRATANLIREGRVFEINNVIETSFGEGMIDMNRSLIELVNLGEITVEQAYQHSLNPKLLDSIL